MPDFFRWENALYFLPKVLSALPVTAGIVLAATASGLVPGLGAALLQVERVPGLRRLCRLYVSFIRGTPIIIQMFIVYYRLPLLLIKAGIDITRAGKIWFVYITYGINSGAYFSGDFPFGDSGGAGVFVVPSLALEKLFGFIEKRAVHQDAAS